MSQDSRNHLRGSLCCALMLGILVPRTAAASGQQSERPEEILAQLLARAEGAQIEPSVVLEDGYREILAAWAAGSATAPAELATLQQDTEFESPRPSRPLLSGRVLFTDKNPYPCWQAVQDNTFESLAKQEPELLLAMAFFHHMVYAEQTALPLDLRASEFTKTTFFSLVDLYLDRAGITSVTRANAVLMLIALANTLRNLGYQRFGKEARDVFSEALKLDPDNATARYGVAFQEEKLGNYRRAVRHLERLSAARGDDVEVALRLALNLARTGKLRAATDALASIARGDGPAELRILAYQELARLHAEEHGARAIAYLREARERFPQSWRLGLQLSNLLYRDWNEAASLVERVATSWEEDPGPSLRFRYESPRQEKAGHARLAREVDRLRPALARALERLATQPLAQRNVFPECRGVLIR